MSILTVLFFDIYDVSKQTFRGYFFLCFGHSQQIPNIENPAFKIYGILRLSMF